jgi:hypothetical protein
MSAAATATILIAIFGPMFVMLFVAYAFFFTRRNGKGMGDLMVDADGEPTIFSKVDQCLKVVFFCCIPKDGDDDSGEPYEIKEERHYKPKYHKLPV